MLEVGGDGGVGVVGRPSGCGSLEDEKAEDEEGEGVAVEMVVEVDDQDDQDEGLDGLPVLAWGVFREVGSSTACLNHQHVERRGQDRGSGGTWDSPGAGLREGVLRGCWCAAGLRGRSEAWVRLCRPRLLGSVYALSHPGKWHLKGRAPVWVVWCRLRLLEVVKGLPHTLHWYGRSPVWDLSCSLRWLA